MLRLAIKNIKQVDDYHFQIDFSDGAVGCYRLSKLQSACPCAACFDPETKERKEGALAVDPEVKAKRLYSVGRYGLKIEFSSGCSAGIYDYFFLRSQV